MALASFAPEEVGALRWDSLARLLTSVDLEIFGASSKNSLRNERLRTVRGRIGAPFTVSLHLFASGSGDFGW